MALLGVRGYNWACISDVLGVSGGGGGGWMREPGSFLGRPQWWRAKGTWGPKSLGLAASWPQNWGLVLEPKG